MYVTCFILKGRKYDIIEIGMSHETHISVSYLSCILEGCI